MRIPRIVSALLLAVVFAAAGCATTGAGSVGDPNALAQEDFARSDARNAYELIEHLRPRWLQQRFDRSLRLPTSILVYQNNVRLGGLDVLRDISVQGIHSIRYVGSAEAGRLPGAGSAAVDGAILIFTAPERQ
jgi:hypothetical protein